MYKDVDLIQTRKEPSRLAMILEVRALLDLASVPISLLRSRNSDKNTEGMLPIILFPGFGSDERYLKLLGRFLKNLGYVVEDWGLGKNLAGFNLPHSLEDLSPTWEFDYPKGYSPDRYNGDAGVPFLCDKAIERVKKRSEVLGSSVVVIGWSLGGYIARECARELPKHNAQVITFGTPVIGGPKYTRAVSYFKDKNIDVDWIEKSIDRRNKNLIQQPITAIYSKSDGIVSRFSAIDDINPNVSNIHVNCAHLGMGFNAKIWRIIKAALEKESQHRQSLRS